MIHINLKHRTWKRNPVLTVGETRKKWTLMKKSGLILKGKKKRKDDIITKEAKKKVIIHWQCVKCSAKNFKKQKMCTVCGADRNPKINCDICRVNIPFLCFGPHSQAHEKNGQKSPVSVAFKLIEKLRDPTLCGVQSCVCWDFVLDFVWQYQQFINKGLRDPPIIIYHWTKETNFQSIIDGNLVVPGEKKRDGRQLVVANGSALGVGIYSHTDPFWGRGYGAGAKKMIMCLAVRGKVSSSHGNARKNHN
eukprot:UN27782